MTEATATPAAATGCCVWCGGRFPLAALYPVPETSFVLCAGCLRRYEGEEVSDEPDQV